MDRKTKEILKKILIILGAALVYLAVSLVVVYFTEHNGTFPSGNRVFFHLYRGDILAEEMAHGNFFPLLDRLWYNGTELMRYQAPVPAYFLALCILPGGGIGAGYLRFLFLLCFLSGMEWLFIGFSRKRPIVGAGLGLIWFFSPVHLHLLYVQGDLSGSLVLLLFPLLLHFLLDYLQKAEIRKLLIFWIVFFFMLLTELFAGGIVALGLVLFLLVDIPLNKHGRRSVHAALAMTFCVVSTGIWTYPAFMGGYFTSRAARAATAVKPVSYTLNPVSRIFEGYGAPLYQFLGILLLTLMGLFLA